MNIYDFINNPYECVLDGYQPSFLDCVAVYANDLPSAWASPFTVWKELLDIWHMEIGELFRFLLLLPVMLTAPFWFAIAIWPLGFRLHKRLKKYPERMCAAAGVKGE